MIGKTKIVYNTITHWLAGKVADAPVNASPDTTKSVYSSASNDAYLSANISQQNHADHKSTDEQVKLQERSRLPEIQRMSR